MNQDFHLNINNTIYIHLSVKKLSLWEVIKYRIMGRRALGQILNNEFQQEIERVSPRLEKTVMEQAEKFFETHLIQ